MNRIKAKFRFIKFSQISNYFLYGIVFTLPLNIAANSICIILFTLSSILAAIYEKSGFDIYQNKKWLLIFSSLFIIQFIGLAYSDEKRTALGLIERSLTLLIFPFVIIPDRKRKDATFFKRIIIVFIVSCLIVIFYSWSVVIYENIQAGKRFSYLFHWEYSHNQLIHFSDVSGTYFTMYLLFLMSAIVFYIEKGIFRGISRYIFLFVIIVCIAFILHLNSKIGILIFLFLVTTYFIFKAFVLKSLVPILVIILAFLFIGAAIYNMSYFNKRVLEYMVNINEGEIQVKEGRLSQWKAILNNFDGNVIWGYGTGATKKHVLNAYKKEELYKALENKYNAHNQFIQFFIANGVIGLFCFSLCLIIPLKMAFTNKAWLYVTFICIFAITSLTESTMLRQKGIVFFTLFNSLLIANYVKPPIYIKSKYSAD